MSPPQPRPPKIFVFALLLSAACDTSPEPEGGETGGYEAQEPCAPSEAGNSDPYLDCVEYLRSPLESYYNHELLPEVVQGPPGGTLDTVSIGCGGEMVVFFDDPVIVDGPGTDFVVFENPFTAFPEPAQVSVSEDGVEWFDFECDPLTLEGCAGVTPVLAEPGSEVDPTDPMLSGGDLFDLAEIGVSRARYLKFSDRSAEYWATMDRDFCDPGEAGKGGFDLDAAVIVNAEGS
jgi:hypothetical protein